MREKQMIGDFNRLLKTGHDLKFTLYLFVEFSIYYLLLPNQRYISPIFIDIMKCQRLGMLIRKKKSHTVLEAGRPRLARPMCLTYKKGSHGKFHHGRCRHGRKRFYIKRTTLKGRECCLTSSSRDKFPVDLKTFNQFPLPKDMTLFSNTINPSINLPTHKSLGINNI